MRAAPTENYETEYVDVDKLLDLYIEQFKTDRLALQAKY